MIVLFVSLPRSSVSPGLCLLIMVLLWQSFDNNNGQHGWELLLSFIVLGVVSRYILPSKRDVWVHCTITKFLFISPVKSHRHSDSNQLVWEVDFVFQSCWGYWISYFTTQGESWAFILIIWESNKKNLQSYSPSEVCKLHWYCGTGASLLYFWGAEWLYLSKSVS